MITNKNIIETRFIAWSFPISHAHIKGIFYKNGIAERAGFTSEIKIK